MNKFLIAILLFICVVGFSASSVSAGTLHFDGSKKLVGRVEIWTVYNGPDGYQHSKTILSEKTYANHRQWNKEIPNEAKYNDILIRQTVSGKPKDVGCTLLNYGSGDVYVDYTIDSVWKKSGSRLTVDYEGKRAVAVGDTDRWYVYWAR